MEREKGVMHKSELPLNVNNYYKIVVIFEIFSNNFRNTK
jgi:hypothetical protein